MSWSTRAAGGLRALLAKQRAEEELDEELRAFVSAAAGEKMSAGMSAEAARRAVRLETGSLDAVKEKVRAVGWEARVEAVWQDVRFGGRMLARSPGSTAVALATLALGIGVNTAVFSLAASLWLRPLPVADPGRLAVLALQKRAGTLQDQFSHAHYEDLRAQTREVFAGLMGFQYGIDGLTWTGGRTPSRGGAGRTERILTSYVTGDYFTVLGLAPALGRLLLPAEGTVPGADPVAVLSYSYWQTRFAGDPGAVGRRVLVNGQPVTIAGVAPAGFHGARALLDTQAYLPLAMAVPLEGFGADLLHNRGVRNLVLMARLRPGVTLERARAALRLAGDRLARQHPESDAGLRLSLYAETAARPRPQSGGRMALGARLFLGLAALVLALACLNVTDLALVRAAAREREMVIRSALGAGRRRLVRQLLTESLLLGALAGIAGALAGAACGRAASALRLENDLPLLPSFAFDWRVFAYAALAAILAGLAAGIAPALQAARGGLAGGLRGGGRGLTSRRRRLRDGLVAAQVGASLTLLIAAGLFARSLDSARRQDLGFDADQVLDFSLDAAATGLPEEQGRRRYQELLARVRTLPGVAAASLASAVPMGDGFYENTLLIPGYQPPPGQPAPLLDYNMVSPGYFETLRIPLLLGRAFTGEDCRGAPLVAVVNRTMADRFWPHAHPLGRRFAMASHPEAVFRIVGVVADSRNVGTAGAIEPFFYIPLAQKYAAAEVLHVRTLRPPASLLPDLRRAIAAAAPDLLVAGAGTLRGALGGMRGYLLFQLGAVLAAALGSIGLGLAVLGVYGVVASSASQRRREIGIRMALGAERAAIVEMMLRQGMPTVGLGLAAGVLAALAASRLLGTFLVGVSATDPLTYAVVTPALALVALAACYWPARRSTRIDPALVLRCE